MTENLSSHFVVGFFANSPTQRRVSCPSTNGKKQLNRDVEKDAARNFDVVVHQEHR